MRSTLHRLVSPCASNVAPLVGGGAATALFENNACFENCTSLRRLDMSALKGLGFLPSRAVVYNMGHQFRELHFLEAHGSERATDVEITFEAYGRMRRWCFHTEFKC